MSRIHTLGRTALLLAIILAAEVRAGQPADGSDLFGKTVPTQGPSDPNPAVVALQIAPEFAIWDGNQKIIPRVTGLPYQIEQRDGSRLLLAAPSQGLRGWAPSNTVVSLDRAEAYFSHAIKANAGNPFAFLMRGVGRRKSGDLERAMADLDESLRLDPKYLPALIERAALWRAKNQPDRALADLDRAIQIDGSDPLAFAERGVLYFNMKDYTKSRKDLDRAVSLESRVVIVDIVRGMLDLEKKDTKSAYENFAHALSIDPKRHDAYLGLASVYLMRGVPKTAETILDEAVQADPYNPEAYGNRALLFLTRGIHEKALFNLNEVIRLAPSSARAHQERAWLLATCPSAKIRDGREAVASGTRACELTEWKKPRYLSTLAAAYSETGDFSNAVKCQEMAMAFMSAKAPERAEYARILERYRIKKPYRSLTLLEEMGLKAYQPATKPGDGTPG
jgi:tetratricopeptide (TPR) repeat protein